MIIAAGRIYKTRVGVDIALALPATLNIAIGDRARAVNLLGPIIPEYAVSNRPAASGHPAAPVFSKVVTDSAVDNCRAAVLATVHATASSCSIAGYSTVCNFWTTVITVDSTTVVDGPLAFGCIAADSAVGNRRTAGNAVDSATEVCCVAAEGAVCQCWIAI